MPGSSRIPRPSTRKPRRSVSGPVTGRMVRSSGMSAPSHGAPTPPRRVTIGLMTSFSALERARLADALAATDPDAPTLCEGWTALDLAAHLVVRERRPDSTPGIMLRPLAGWTDRVRRGYAQRPYADLIRLIRTGPPRTSPFALPGADSAGNLAEHFVHCEDVRRGRGPAPAAQLADGLQDELWRRLT